MRVVVENRSQSSTGRLRAALLGRADNRWLRFGCAGLAVFGVSTLFYLVFPDPLDVRPELIGWISLGLFAVSAMVVTVGLRKHPPST